MWHAQEGAEGTWRAEGAPEGADSGENRGRRDWFGPWRGAWLLHNMSCQVHIMVLQRKGLADKGSAVGRALGNLKKTLRRALELVRACQEDQSFVQRVLRAEDLSNQLRQVKQDILQELSMATFAINAHMAPDAHHHHGQRQLDQVPFLA